MQTEVMKMFGLEAPIFAFSHCRDVVAAVCRAGGIGTLGTTHITKEQLEIELNWLDAHTDGKPYGVDLMFASNEPKEYAGITMADADRYIPEEHRQFVSDLMREHDVPEFSQDEREALFADYMRGLVRTHKTAEDRMEIVYEHPLARLLVSALGVPPQHVLDRAHRHGIKVAGMVGKPEHAPKHLAAGVDIIIAAGYEAAGHTGDISTMVLMPQVVDLVAPIPVLHAGGIMRGRQIAAALALGAQGVWTGTVWLGTVESECTPLVREKLFAATSSDTLRSRCGTGKPARRLRSAWVDAWEADDAPRALPMPLQSMLVNEALERMDKFQPRELVSYPAGQGVGMMNQETSVRSVVYDMLSELGETMETLSASFNELTDA